MDKSAIIISAVQIFFSIAATVCFIIGLHASVKDIQYINNENPDEELAHTQAAFRKAMKMIGCGIGLYFLSRVCYNLPLMAEHYGIGVIALQALWDAVRYTGALLILPFILKAWRKSARKRAYRE